MLRLVPILLLSTALAAACGPRKRVRPMVADANVAKAQPDRPAPAPEAPVLDAGRAPTTSEPGPQPSADGNAAATPDAGATAPAADGGSVVSARADGSATPEVMDRDTLAKAFVQIYCAQRKGEVERLLEIYKRYGFHDPQAWIDAWKQAREDDEWVARLTQDAVNACP